MSNFKTIPFLDACAMIQRASLICIDQDVYDLKITPQEKRGTLVLQRRFEPNPGDNRLVVWFRGVDNQTVRLDGDAVIMQEEYGDEAKISLTGNFAKVARFATAETAAALMDAIHSDVTQQYENSESAYEELYKVAQQADLGFPGVWSWIALLAEAAGASMETRWAAGSVEFIDCVHVAAQEFHNYITDPAIRPVTEMSFTRERAEMIWERTVDYLRERDRQEIERAAADERRKAQELRAQDAEAGSPPESVLDSPDAWLTPAQVRKKLRSVLGLNTKQASVRKARSPQYLTIALHDPNADIKRLHDFCEALDTWSMGADDVVSGQSVKLEFSPAVQLALALQELPVVRKALDECLGGSETSDCRDGYYLARDTRWVWLEKNGAQCSTAHEPRSECATELAFELALNLKLQKS